MLLHGHTDASIRAISPAAKLAVLRRCQEGLVGPLAPSMAASRVAGQVWNLQESVLSALTRTPARTYELYGHWPELTPPEWAGLSPGEVLAQRMAEHRARWDAMDWGDDE